MLSSCKEALDRFEWRHNNVVKYLHTLFSSQGLEGVEIYADVDGHRVNGVTIPPDLANGHVCSKAGPRYHSTQV